MSIERKALVLTSKSNALIRANMFKREVMA
jgi:hypothetical protein